MVSAPIAVMGTVDGLPAHKRVKRSHGSLKRDTESAKLPARAAVLAGEDDLLLLEAGGSSEAALLELQVGDGSQRPQLQQATSTSRTESSCGRVLLCPCL